MIECSPSSASVLHKQWVKLENEHHELAIAIDTMQVKKTDVALMRKRQERLLLEITFLVAKIRDAPATTIEDCLALLDVAIEHELDLACEMAFYGPAEYPIITRLFRYLAREAPGFEFNSLRRWLSVPGQFEQLTGRGTDLETAEIDGGLDEPKETAESNDINTPRREPLLCANTKHVRARGRSEQSSHRMPDMLAASEEAPSELGLSSDHLPKSETVIAFRSLTEFP